MNKLLFFKKGIFVTSIFVFLEYETLQRRVYSYREESVPIGTDYLLLRVDLKTEKERKKKKTYAHTG